MTIAAVQARISELRIMLGETPPVVTVEANASGRLTTDETSGLAGEFVAALAEATSTPAKATSTTDLTGSTLIESAKKYLGVDYVWGGESLGEGGLDCSGLVQLAMKDIGGPAMPRTAREQQKVGEPVGSLSEAKPGDLLFFDQPATHVAIYLGDGQMLDAPKPGDHVRVRDVYKTPTTISRVLPTEASTSASAGIESAKVSADAQRAMLDILASMTSAGVAA